MATDINAYWDEFMEAVAETDQPRRAFEVLQRITEETVGTKLFTAMTYDAVAGLARRTYSGNETAYPTGGFKPMSIGIWSETVIEKQQPYVSNTIEPGGRRRRRGRHAEPPRRQGPLYAGTDGARDEAPPLRRHRLHGRRQGRRARRRPRGLIQRTEARAWPRPPSA